MIEGKELKIDTSKIPPHRARAIGRAFYYAYMNFIKDSENRATIERESKKRSK